MLLKPIRSQAHALAAAALAACLLAACQAGPVSTPTAGAATRPATASLPATRPASATAPATATTQAAGAAASATPTTPTATPTRPPASATAANTAAPASATPAPATATPQPPTHPPATSNPSGGAPRAGETPAGPAGGPNSLIVNDLGDGPDAVLDGRCATGNSGSVCTLRAALQEANAQPDLNTILFAEGLSGAIHLGAALPAVTEGVSITGPGPAVLTLDAGRNGYRVLTFDSPGNNQAFELAGLTLTNGQSTLGGGLYLGLGDILNLTNSALVANEASDGAGGGLYNAGGSLSVSSAQISHNRAAGAGGGVYNVDGSLTLISTIITHNAAAGGEGGGVRFAGASLSIQASTFRQNTASANGGGLWSSGNALLSGVTLEANSGVNGGGAYNRSGILTLLASTVAANTGANGAGLFNFGGALFLTNATLSGNAAAQNGGGLYNADTVTLNNVTVAFNSAGLGGGLINQGGTLSLKNTLVALQTAGGDCAGSLNSLGHNLDSDLTCGLGAPGDRPGLDPRLDPLAYSGGSTATHRLHAGSPAIDAGNDSGCPTVGQRGLPRPQDGPDEDTLPTCDIGAVEYTPGLDP